MAADVKDEMFKKAKGYALRLLKLRPRSCHELGRKMALKGYDTELVVKIVAELTASGYLDDAAFARAWLTGRLGRPMGFRRVACELADKGIPKDVVLSLWDEVKENYDELGVVRGLAQKRARQYNNIDPLKRRKRVMDYLIRRGFALNIIMKVIHEL